ncbi:MAG: HNH endonuclease signature motif containing protein [Xylophilus ampelinus]
MTQRLNKPRIPAATHRISAAPAGRIQQAPRMAATPRTRGRKWMTRRERWLSEHPLCVECQARGQVTAGEEVDHIVPLWAGGADDESNYQTLCRTDHAAKTAREAADRSKV